MQNLNPEQLQAVKHLDGPLMLLAGAGSGKTNTVTSKVVYLIENNINRILAVTFTNKAAKEMQARIQKKLGPQELRKVQISTFHTLGLKFIKEEHQILNIAANFSIYDQEDSLLLLKSLQDQKAIADHYIKSQLQKISSWKNLAITPKQALENANDEFSLDTANLYQTYQNQLQSYNAVDFDDLIMLPYIALLNNSELKEKWQNKFQYILVDEYQDTSIVQYELLKTIVGVRGAITVVGDDQQSVYNWRGADVKNLKKLSLDYPNLTTIMLEQNYRSMGNILKVANALIKHNSSLFEKNLWTNKGPGNLIKIICCKDEETESQRIAHEILIHKFQHGKNYNDYAVLYRSNHQAKRLEKSLRESRIPYVLSGGSSFFDKTEVKDLLSYFKLLVNPEDNAAFLRVVNVPKREIGLKTLEDLGNYAKNREISLFAACQEIGLSQIITEKAYNRLNNFCQWLILNGDNATRGNTLEVIKNLIQEINYENWIFDKSNNKKQAEQRINNIKELMQWLQRLLEEEQLTLAEALQKMLVVDLLQQQDEQSNNNAVNLMTLHAAKGLEFNIVYIIGFEENILPHKTSIEQEQIEEERRLAYVGITRAMQQLIISYSQVKTQYQNQTPTEPSRFLYELPKELLDWELPNQPKSKEELQAKRRVNLQAIKDILSKANN